MNGARYSDRISCEAVWVVAGVESVCGKTPTQVVHYRSGPVRACRQCAADLSDFEQYHAERAAVTS